MRSLVVYTDDIFLDTNALHKFDRFDDFDNLDSIDTIETMDNSQLDHQIDTAQFIHH